MRLWMMALPLALTLPGSAQAGVLRCQFTEPFYSITFDSQTGTVTWLSADETDPDTGKPIPKVTEGARLRVVNPNGDGPGLVLEKGAETIVELRLTGKGSDGMSENIFPFEARSGRNDGGCDTAKYPSWDFYYLLEDLGVPQ